MKLCRDCAGTPGVTQKCFQPDNPLKKNDLGVAADVIRYCVEERRCVENERGMRLRAIADSSNREKRSGRWLQCRTEKQTGEKTGLWRKNLFKQQRNIKAAEE